MNIQNIFTIDTTGMGVVKEDITRIAYVDAVVNAADPSLLGGGGVDGAIHCAAGPGLLNECRSLGGCRTGEARLTNAYEMPCNHIIHTVGPVWRGGDEGEADLLTACYRNSLKLAVENGIQSVAFPSISTGRYSYPLQEAAYLAVHAVADFIEEHPGKLMFVVWACIDDMTRGVYQRALEVAADEKGSRMQPAMVVVATEEEAREAKKTGRITEDSERSEFLS